MDENRCLICQHTVFDELLHLPQFPLFFGAIPPEHVREVECFPLTIGICHQCNLVQQLNLLPEAVIRRVYSAAYYSCPSPVLNGMGRSMVEEFYTFFRNCDLRPGRVLEIACFDGFLLKKLQNDGWEVYGCDPSPMAQVAMQYLGETGCILNQYFTRDTVFDGLFDVIVFRNLLEHIYDLQGFLESVSANLKPNGRIFIDVPNLTHILGLNSWGSFFHQHVSYFSSECLALLLRQHQFEVEEIHSGPSLVVSAIKRSSEFLPLVPPRDRHLRKIQIEQFLNQRDLISQRIASIFNDPNYQKIAIFGASVQATLMIQLLPPEAKRKIYYIFDNDTLKHGKVLYGCSIPISSPSLAHKVEWDVVLIATHLFRQPITEQLLSLGIAPEKIAVWGLPSTVSV